MEFLEISQNLQENTCARVSFLISGITLVATSVTQKLAHYHCVKHAGTQIFYPCNRKCRLEKSHTPAYFTLCMSWLAKLENRKVTTVSGAYLLT